ncbi:uncharacterized protein (TIGR02453 family) [Arthrobacter sp. PvP102]|uniref:DUF2461 domain-containing protein n=1 Tax=unclassified Arthrobacter TaxID=235627 RepID=UPI001AE0F053|nr:MULTISPECIES: DUF2461 domain-containing protein [unclassified Arthrobacter]MBP1232397.1 uncharacterized protein (TIGR02453 family) [Arthrobacter sp. PvP103]MBP1237532.1 uncharacterized protein (TIGR02453 family) [Arthrobacter sp. PvP102]
MTTFQGIPAAAFGFYAELEQNNNREWWLGHKRRYESLVREPLAALLAQLEPRFGPAKIFRPNRDVRFSPDKSPYKTAQGALASFQEGVGYYVQLSADGLLVGGGCHSSSPAQLARFRNSVDATGTGESLAQIVRRVSEAGFTVEGERLKTVPRGFPRDHPRAELLKYKSLSAAKALGEPDWLATPAAAEEVSRLWEQLRPLVEWVGRHAAP